MAEVRDSKILNRKVANRPEVQKAVQAAAEKVAAAARTRASGHGQLASDIVVRKANRTDYEVVLDRPDAQHIEFGHYTGGVVYGHPYTGAPKWVAGLHVMRNAAKDVT